MSRIEVPVTTIARAGVSQATQITASTLNHYFTNDGTIFIEIESTDAGTQTVTFPIPKLIDGDLVITDLIVSIAASGKKLTGPFKVGIFNQFAAGVTETDPVFVNPSVPSTLKFRAYSLPA